MVSNEEAKINKECHEVAYDVMGSAARWLENPDNEIFSLLEEHEPSVEIAAKACVQAAAILKKASFDIQLVSGISERTEDLSTALDKLRALADEFDNSGDPALMKKAGLLDEIMLTVAADVEEQTRFKISMNKKLADIRKRSEELNESKKVVAESHDQKEKPQGKVYEENEASLSTRYCPDHPGVPVYRKSDGVVQCSLDGKTYNYNDGFTTAKGNHIPGSSVEKQTDLDSHISNPLAVEDTRETRQNSGS